MVESCLAESLAVVSLSLASFSERLIVGEGVNWFRRVGVSDQRGGGVGVVPDL